MLKLVGKVKLKKVNAFSVVDQRTGLILAIETNITRANDARSEHPGSRVQMDQYDEEQLAELLHEQARRESHRPPQQRYDLALPPRQVIRSLTVVDGYDALTMLDQSEIDAVVLKMRSLRLGTLPEVTDEELEPA